MQISPTESPSAASAHLGLIGWACIVGVSFPVVGLMTEGLPPLYLTAARFALAATVLLPLVIRFLNTRLQATTVLLYGCLGFLTATFFGAMFWAAHRASALSMAALFVTIPIMAYVFGRGLGVENPARALPAILLLGATGAVAMAWANTGSDGRTLDFGAGEAVYFAGCLAVALSSVLTKWGLNRRLLPPQASLRAFWTFVAGSMEIGALALLVESPLELARFTLDDAMILVYLAVFSSGVTTLLTQRATPVLTPSTVAAYSYLTPVTATLVLFALQPDSFTWHWLPGGVIVLTAIALLLGRDLSGAGKDRAQNFSIQEEETHENLVNRIRTVFRRDLNFGWRRSPCR